MKRVFDFLKKAGTFYLATAEGDQPRVRPFGSVMIYEGKLYLCTDKTKKVSQQIQKNPKIEICAFANGTCMRLQAEAVRDDRAAAKEAMLEAEPMLKKMHSPDDGRFEVLYLANAVATFDTRGKEPEVTRL